MEIFKIEPGLFIWTWVSFGILLFIMTKFVFPSLTEGLKLREKTISDSVDKALEIDKRLKAIEKEHETIIASANKKADQILREVRKNADDLKKTLLKKAEQEAESLLADATLKIKEEREAILNSLRAELAELICDASEKIVDKSFTDEMDLEWSRELVEKL